MKKEERRILKILNRRSKDFKEQHMVNFRCLGPDRDGDRAFVDFLVEVRNADMKIVGYIFLEIDEDQHESYSVKCELRRMTDIHRSIVLEGNTIPIAFVRYNPNTYRIGGAIQLTPKRDREAHLEKVLSQWTFTKPFEIVYLYYDQTDGELDMWKDPAYEQAVRDVARIIPSAD